jgi:general secretion pathway protein G
VRQSLPILVLFAILGIVGLYAIKPRHSRTKSRPAPLADIHGGIKSALDAFKVDNGTYPKGSNGLVELVQQPAGATNWRGPYLEKLPIDWWGNKYIYESPGKHNPNGYDLFTTGPDGKAGTDDDIGNWMN